MPAPPNSAFQPTTVETTALYVRFRARLGEGIR